MSTQVTILGNTGRDVELRYTQQGTPVANFSIASNSRRNTPAGPEKKTDWFNVSAFGNQAETLAKYLRKGATILVRGKLTFNPWMGRDGEARVNADVILQDFEFAGGNAAKTNGEASEEAIPARENDRAMAAAAGSEEAAEEAEMLAALHETKSAADEPFADQY